MQIEHQELGPPQHVRELSRDFLRANKVPLTKEQLDDIWEEIREDRRIKAEKANRQPRRRTSGIDLLKRLMGKG